MKPHLLFITSTNLASNPRCRKEINLAVKAGFKVSYIAFDLSNWTKEKEDQIQQELVLVKKKYIDTGKKIIIEWVVFSLLETLLRKAYYFLSTTSLVSIAISRRSLQLLLATNNLKEKPDLIIAHNLPAFYPAYYLSKKNNVPFAIDVEDYHPGEGNDKKIERLSLTLIKRILPSAVYVSFAAPLIKEKIILDVLPDKIKQSIIVDNVFSTTEFLKPRINTGGKIRLVWFSQNIAENRGLELILPVIEKFQRYYEITLIGNVREAFYLAHLKDRPFINIVSPLMQSELNKKLSEFDIGLAIEPGKDANNSIALSNKIWSYYQAGLFIIASNTLAQQRFIKEFNKHGMIVDLNDKLSLERDFKNIYHQWDDLSGKRFARFEDAKGRSWEIDSRQLKLKWKEILNF